MTKRLDEIKENANEQGKPSDRTVRINTTSRALEVIEDLQLVRLRESFESAKNRVSLFRPEDIRTLRRNGAWEYLEGILKTNWEDVEASLLVNNAAELKGVSAMQEGGMFWGVDKNGNYLFKDGGETPVMLGFDDKEEPVTVYNREPEDMGRIKKFADYMQSYKAVYGEEKSPTRYELFPKTEKHDFNDFDTERPASAYEKKNAIAAVEALTGKPFISFYDPRMPDYPFFSKDGKTAVYAWLNSGRNPDNYANQINFVPSTNDTFGGVNNAKNSSGLLGVVRLRRVPCYTLTRGDATSFDA